MTTRAHCRCKRRLRGFGAREADRGVRTRRLVWMPDADMTPVAVPFLVSAALGMTIGPEVQGGWGGDREGPAPSVARLVIAMRSAEHTHGTTVGSGSSAFLGAAPVGGYAPNGFGLYNIVGNVWEWCADRFSPDAHRNGPRHHSTGPPSGSSKVIRGGSSLCHSFYCNRYRVAAHSANTRQLHRKHGVQDRMRRLNGRVRACDQSELDDRAGNLHLQAVTARTTPWPDQPSPAAPPRSRRRSAGPPRRRGRGARERL
jgi:Sulfatase-modifying factor enzyme 1